MPPIRRSNRVRKPKVHWEPPPPTRRRQPPAITIYTDSSEDLSPEDLVIQPPKDLDLQPEDLATQSVKNQSYQSQFLSKDRADRSQNIPENITSVKLFQLFFTVKEIENIVKQTNQ